MTDIESLRRLTEAVETAGADIAGFPVSRLATRSRWRAK